MGVQEEPLLAIHARSTSPGRRSSRKASAMAPKDLVNICAILLIVFTGVTFYQRVEVERSVARKNSARCELVYNEAQSEVALWRAKYNAEIVAKAVHCDTNMTRKMEEALNVSSTLLASALAVCPIFTTSRIRSDERLPLTCTPLVGRLLDLGQSEAGERNREIELSSTGTPCRRNCRRNEAGGPKPVEGPHCERPLIVRQYDSIEASMTLGTAVFLHIRERSTSMMSDAESLGSSPTLRFILVLSVIASLRDMRREPDQLSTLARSWRCPTLHPVGTSVVDNVTSFK